MQSGPSTYDRTRVKGTEGERGRHLLPSAFDDEDGNAVSDTVEIIYRTKRPKRVRQYVIGEALGKGSYATVKEAIDSNTMRVVAIKIMNKRQLRKIPNGEENVMKEISIMRKLKHPNVIELIEFFTDEDSGKLYLVMEYAAGGTLEEYVIRITATSRLPDCQIRSFFSQLVCGVEYLHEQGIFHGDIKPRNVLLTHDGQVKIADFGVAEQLSQIESGYARSKGSPAFQPPEVASGAKVCSGTKADVWAMGVTLFYLATGRYPFEGSTVFALFENISKGDYTIPEWVDSRLSDLIRCILTLDPEKRYTIQQIKQHDWLLRPGEHETREVMPPIISKEAESRQQARIAALQQSAKELREGDDEEEPDSDLLDTDMSSHSSSIDDSGAFGGKTPPGSNNRQRTAKRKCTCTLF